MSEIKDGLKWERERACHVLVGPPLNCICSLDNLIIAFSFRWQYFLFKIRYPKVARFKVVDYLMMGVVFVNTSYQVYPPTLKRWDAWALTLDSYFQDHLLKEGLAWLDSQAAGEAQYWLPALFSELTSRDVSPEEANQMTP